ncbi:MAG: hypothetical protein COA79_01350 [Planctomycetota bacterium]|nr:MAG: hypothetical protein COA79_01350 [Planctomycetota bacterium]
MVQKDFSQFTENHSNSGHQKEPWAVDRIGRLLAGVGIILTTSLGILFEQIFLATTFAIGLHLVISSVSNTCVMRNFLVKIGAKEREKLYNDDGSIKSTIQTCKQVEV